MKTKVQAQRKFAQGAFIPPTLNISNVSVDRRIDVSPNKEKTVFHNRTSAKSLLDIVSFKNLHKHAQPIVLLERLEDRHTLGPRDNGSAPPIVNNPSISNSILNKSSDDQKQAGSSTRVAPRHCKNKAPIITPRLPMHLRSRVIVYNDANKALAYKKKNCIKDRKKVIVSERKQRIKKRPQRLVDEFSVDDDQPLTFFRKKTLRIGPNKNIKRKKLNIERPKSVKYSEPSRRIKERFERRVLKAPDVITEIPDSIIAYIIDMDLDESDHRPHSVRRTSSYLDVDALKERSSSNTEAVSETPISDICQNPVPGPSYKDPVPNSKSIYEDPVPGTSSSHDYPDSVPGTSSSYDDQDPVPGTSSNIYENPVPGTSSCNNPVPNTSRSSAYQDPVPGTSNEEPMPRRSYHYDGSSLQGPTISLCSSTKDGVQREATNDVLEAEESNYEKEHGQLNIHVSVAGPSNEIETILMKQPPFYGIKEIDTWISSNMNIVSPPPQVSTRKSSRKRNEQILSTEIDLDVCIGKKVSTLEAILQYGSSYYDCLCLACVHCKNIHELLNRHKNNLLKSMNDERNCKKANEEIASSANGAPSCLNNVRSEAGLGSITIDDDDDKDIKTIDLTDDSNDIQNITVQNVVKNVTRGQNDVQNKVPEENGDQDENMEENGDQDEVVEPDVQPATSAGKKIPPRRRRKRGRGKSAGGPMTRQKSQATVNNKRTKRRRNDADNVPDPTLPNILKHANLISAPVFYPTLKEFADPMAYLEQVMPSAANFGILKVVSPSGFQPPCTMGDNAKFTVSNQYIARFFSRWGPAAREMCAIRAYLASQKVHFSHAPLLDGLEVNLPKLFHIVQKLGGLKSVFNKKKWTRVAEELKIKTVPNPEKKFELLCLKYLLPYDTLTKREREAMMMHVEREWCKKSAKMLSRVANPLHQQKRLLGDSDASDDDQDDGDGFYAQAISEAEDCVVPGRSMSLGTFKKIADTALKMYFPSGELPPTTSAIEELYWSIVLLGTDHVSINAAFIDSDPEGYGFPKNKNVAYGKHPWNLKMLSSNNRNVLRYLGSVSGVTVPSLHVGMVFSTSCWHRDPHGLPWIEYMHEGPDKIWYGVPEGQSSNFRTAAQALCPTSCQHKPIWLSSDIAMIPPHLLLEQNVRLSRVVQRPGEFIVVMPNAYSCSISTGFTISESVYFATNSYLQKVYPVFKELRESCEPSIFSLEQLLISMSKDPRTPRYLQHQVHGYLSTIVEDELLYQNALNDLNVPVQHDKRRVVTWNLRDEEECQICRTALYLSRVLGVFGKNSKLCQQHAVRVLNDRKREGKLDLTGIVLEISITITELDETIKNLQKHLLSSP